MPIRPRKKPGRVRYLEIDPELDQQFEELFVKQHGLTYLEAIQQAMRRHLANPPPPPKEPDLPPLPPVTPAPAAERPAGKKGKVK